MRRILYFIALLIAAWTALILLDALARHDLGVFCIGLFLVAGLSIPVIPFIVSATRSRRSRERKEAKLRSIGRERERRRLRHQTSPARTELRLEHGDPFHVSDEGEIIFDGKSPPHESTSAPDVS